ncbi:hypothetical protein CYMTET_16442 [Cymbomonas tetramitiformis]|uniref:Uncharacterized protein n=1 Tax=Cymbomonas tetramitiformis TaxID=36881 RepID=A0AAE0GC79_9CHLO|nr:hypothetical protein CYMTET_16442 [Cymbomonas tetramitiformis]
MKEAKNTPLARRLEETAANVPPRYNVKWHLHVLYKTPKQGESLLNEKALRRIRDIERSIVTLPEYPRFCVQVQTGPKECASPTSLMPYLFPAPGEETSAPYDYTRNYDMADIEITMLNLLRRGTILAYVVILHCVEEYFISLTSGDAEMH